MYGIDYSVPLYYHLTPIYFETRRETEWDIPPISLPPEGDHPNVIMIKQLMLRDMISVEAARKLFQKGND